MTESIIAELARIEGLRVISRTSAMRFKGSEMSIIDIAKALNVDAIVEGSVLKADDMVRITAQLIDGDTDEHLWAKAFDRNLDQILNLQRDVARSIATEINMTLNPREEEYFSESKSVNTTAYQLYLKGWYHRLRETTESLALAYDYFSQALEIDPGLVEAHAAMVVMSYIGIGRGINDIEEGISDPKTFAKYSAEKAVSLNPGSPEAQLSMALYQQLFELDFTAAELSFKTALNLRPGDAELRREYGLYLTRMGRYAEAKAQLDLSYAADPMSQLVLRDLGTVNLRLGNIQVAHEQLKSSFELESGDRRTAMLLGLSYLALGDGDQSLQFFKDYKRENSIRFFEGEWLMMERVGLQEVLNAEADSLTEESEREEWRPYPKAIIAVLDKRYSDAFDYLEVVINEKSGRTVNILESVYFDPLIHLPRFKELLLRAGYPDVELKSISQLLDQINLSTE